MPLRLIPKDIIEGFRLHRNAVDGYVYMEIRKGMYDLPQAGILANKLLKNSVLHAMGTLNSPTCLASGNMSHNPSGSTCAWMALATNTLVVNTSSTFLLLFGWRRTTLLKIGWATSIVVSLLHGTVTNGTLT
jgi:hypothetical protein